MKPRPVTLAGFCLEGEDGNAYSIISRFRRAARNAGWAPARIEALTAEAKSSDYNHLLWTFIPYEDRSEEDD